MCNIPQEAPDNMLQEPYCLLVYQLCDHIAENGADSVKALVGLADVLQAHVV